LHRNALTGAVPFQLCDLRKLETLNILITSCGGELKKVACDCCTDCEESGNDEDTHNIDTQQLDSPSGNNGSDIDSNPTSSRRALLYAMCNRISGKPASIKESPQNLAMNWMIDHDKSNLGEDNYYLVQRYVMAVMYFSLCEETWAFHTWLSPTKNECLFQGVTCDANKMITKLTFNKTGIVGTLPPEISNLSEVTFIDFSKNKISGGIPTKWRSLSNLAILNLGGNEIVGPMTLCSLYFEQSLKMVEVDCTKILCACCSKCDDIIVQPPKDIIFPIDDDDDDDDDDDNTIRSPKDISQSTIEHPIYPTDDGDNTIQPPKDISQINIVVPIFPSDDARAKKIRQELQKVSAVPYYAPNQVRIRAQDWIIFEDSQTLSPNFQYLKQRYILVMLYFALDGENWTNTSDTSDRWTSKMSSTKWLSANTNCCSWSGVICVEDAFVEGIELSHRNLSGTIPYEIGQLFRLKYLNLSSNHIKQSIPEEIGQMPRLGKIFLKYFLCFILIIGTTTFSP